MKQKSVIGCGVFLVAISILSLIVMVIGQLGLMIKGGIWWGDIRPYWGYSQSKPANEVQTMALLIWILALFSIIASFFTSRVQSNLFFDLTALAINVMFFIGICTCVVLALQKTDSKEKCDNIWQNVYADATTLSGKFDEERKNKFLEEWEGGMKSKLNQYCNNSSKLIKSFLIVYGVGFWVLTLCAGLILILSHLIG